MQRARPLSLSSTAIFLYTYIRVCVRVLKKNILYRFLAIIIHCCVYLLLYCEYINISLITKLNKFFIYNASSEL